MVTFKTQTRTFTFDKKNYPSLIMHEFSSETWHDIGLNDLSPDEQEGLVYLLTESGLADQPDYNPNNVLLVKAADGVLSEVYGPGIFSDGSNIVLKVGANHCILTQKGDRLTVGNLQGKISVSSKVDSVGVEYPLAQVSFISPDKEIFKVRIALDGKNEEVTVGNLEAAILSEESLLPYLAPIPAPVLKMHELGIGEWEVRAISSNEGEYGISHKLHLSTGQVVWARGNSQIVLENGYQMKPGTPLTLVVTSIEEFGDGKYRVENALRERLPRLTGSTQSAEVKTLEAQVKPVAVPENEELDGVNLDEISFVRSVDSTTVSLGLIDYYEIDAQCPQVGISHNFKFM